MTIEAALWSRKARCTLSSEGCGTWGFALSEASAASARTAEPVDCISIPELIESHGIDRISIRKMDIEGGEKDVLDQSEDWIDRVDVLTAELHERLQPGCDLAFQRATKGFRAHRAPGEKITAYRQ